MDSQSDYSADSRVVQLYNNLKYIVDDDSENWKQVNFHIICLL